MQVLLLQNVKGIGKAGEVKTVSDGYAQNLLFPKKLAEVATPEKIAKIKNSAQAKIDEKKLHTDLTIKTLSGLDGSEIELHRKVNSAGALFGSIHISDVREAIKSTHKISVAEEYIHIPEMKTTGEFKAKIGGKTLGKEFLLTIKVIGQ